MGIFQPSTRRRWDGPCSELGKFLGSPAGQTGLVGGVEKQKGQAHRAGIKESQPSTEAITPAILCSVPRDVPSDISFHQGFP